MELKFKRTHPNAVIPEFATQGSAGLDLTAISKHKIYHERFGHLVYIEYDTGLAVEIPEGYVGLVYPRSSISNYNLSLSNAVGVVDSDYRGSIKFRFKPSGTGVGEYEVGNKIGQLIIQAKPTVTVVEVKELSYTNRGSGGYGSTGA